MNSETISQPLGNFLRRQPLYLGVAAAVYAVFWAIGQTVSLRATLIYSFCLGNLATTLLERVHFLSCKIRSRRLLLNYLALLLILTPAMVTVATALVFWADDTTGGGQFRLSPFRTLFWDYLQHGWKFPAVATLIFGAAALLYRVTRERLENSNRELQHTVNMGTAERQSQEHELQRAREIQEGLLPKTIPQIPGFEIAGAWEPARTVSGDYFDVIELGEDKLAICIADVVGKGVAAALLMANVQAAVRAFAAKSVSPSSLCQRVNSALCNIITTGQFVTLFYGLLDGRLNTLRYSNAGHLPPILLRSSGTNHPLDDNGALLGVFPDWQYEESLVKLTPGDRLLLFTDGITEAMHPDGEEFGEERLIAVARDSAGKSAAELKTQLLSAVKEFCRFQLADDATLIVIDVLSAQSAGNKEYATSLKSSNVGSEKVVRDAA